MTLNSRRAGDLELLVEEHDEQIRVRWLGSANARRPSEDLSPFLDDIVEAAEASQRRLVFHFDAIDHLNSSTNVLVMRLVGRLQEKGLHLTVVYDADRPWQKLIFEALAGMQFPTEALHIRSI